MLIVRIQTGDTHMANDAMVKTYLAGRGYFASHLAGLTDEQLTTVPEGAANSILWNVGHIVMSNYGMLHGASGVDVPAPAEWGPLFKGGSDPANWGDDAPSPSEIMNAFNAQADTIIAGLKNDTFDNFQPMELSPELKLNSVDEALGFIIIHEGVHHGNIIVLRKLLGV
jgi:hypothetical protein